MTDILARSGTAATHRSQIMGLLQPDETIYFAMDAWVDITYPAEKMQSGAIVATSSRVLLVLLKVFGKPRVKEMLWREVSQSGMVDRHGRPTALVEARTKVQWFVRPYTGISEDELALLVASMQEAKDAHDVKSGADRSSRLGDQMEELRRQRGF